MSVFIAHELVNAGERIENLAGRFVVSTMLNNRNFNDRYTILRYIYEKSNHEQRAFHRLLRTDDGAGLLEEQHEPRGRF